jgi:hypothetical protein
MDGSSKIEVGAEERKRQKEVERTLGRTFIQCCQCNSCAISSGGPITYRIVVYACVRARALVCVCVAMACPCVIM